MFICAVLHRWHVPDSIRRHGDWVDGIMQAFEQQHQGFKQNNTNGKTSLLLTKEDGSKQLARRVSSSRVVQAMKAQLTVAQVKAQGNHKASYNELRKQRRLEADTAPPEQPPLAPLGQNTAVPMPSAAPRVTWPSLIYCPAAPLAPAPP